MNPSGAKINIARTIFHMTIGKSPTGRVKLDRSNSYIFSGYWYSDATAPIRVSNCEQDSHSTTQEDDWITVVRLLAAFIPVNDFINIVFKICIHAIPLTADVQYSDKNKT